MGNMEDAFRKANSNGQFDMRQNRDNYQRENNRNNGGNRQYSNETSEYKGKVIDGREDYDPIEEGRKLVERMLEDYTSNRNSFKFTTSQLRKILAMAAIVKNKIEMEACEGNVSKNKITPKMQNEIQYIRLKLVYQMGREKAVKTWLKERGINLPEIIKNIVDETKKFDDFLRLLESIVAYKRFFIPDNEGR